MLNWVHALTHLHACNALSCSELLRQCSAAHSLLLTAADPHPGNLIRTPDGRLAILDFGLMTQVDDEIKFGMIEAISHLIHRDYEAIVQVGWVQKTGWTYPDSVWDVLRVGKWLDIRLPSLRRYRERQEQHAV